MGQIYPNYESPTSNIQGKAVSPAPPDEGNILIFSAASNQYAPGDPIVSGPDPVGTAPTKNPVQVAGLDPAGHVEELSTDYQGNLFVNFTDLRDLFQAIVLELRAIRLAITALDNTLIPSDFTPASLDVTGEEEEQ